jgi:hypothetical protein
MWQEIIKPKAFSQLYMVGEAASSHHAWIVSALESVIRAVYIMLEGLNSHDPEYTAYAKAMNLLSHKPKKGDATYDPDDDSELNPGDFPKGKPFYPLPEEMPDLQAGTTSDKVVTHDPKDGRAAGKTLAQTGNTATPTAPQSDKYDTLSYNHVQQSKMPSPTYNEENTTDPPHYPGKLSTPSAYQIHYSFLKKQYNNIRRNKVINIIVIVLY